MPPSTEPCLVVLSPEPSREIPLDAGPASIAIGTAEGCGVRLAAPGVSPIHARLWLSADGPTIHPLSPVGVYVNGTRLMEPCLLRNGDVVRLGRSEAARHAIVQYRYRVRLDRALVAAAAATEPSPAAQAAPPLSGAAPREAVVSAPTFADLALPPVVSPDLEVDVFDVEDGRPGTGPVEPAPAEPALQPAAGRVISFPMRPAAESSDEARLPRLARVVGSVAAILVVASTAGVVATAVSDWNRTTLATATPAGSAAPAAAPADAPAEAQPALFAVDPSAPAPAVPDAEAATTEAASPANTAPRTDAVSGPDTLSAPAAPPVAAAPLEAAPQAVLPITAAVAVPSVSGMLGPHGAPSVADAGSLEAGGSSTTASSVASTPSDLPAEPPAATLAVRTLPALTPPVTPRPAPRVEPRRRSLVSGTTVIDTGRLDRGIAGFLMDGVDVRRSPDAQGRLEFVVEPAGVRPGQPYTLKVYLANDGAKAMKVERLAVLTSVNGDKRVAPHAPLARQVPAGGKALVDEMAGVWPDGLKEWSADVIVTTKGDTHLRNRIALR